MIAVLMLVEKVGWAKGGSDQHNMFRSVSWWVEEVIVIIEIIIIIIIIIITVIIIKASQIIL